MSDNIDDASAARHQTGTDDVRRTTPALAEMSVEARAAYAAADVSNHTQLSLIQLIVRSMDERAVLTRLGLSEQELQDLVHGRRVHSYLVDQTVMLPKWQFTHDALVPHVAEVVAAAGPTHAQVLAGFMERPQGQLVIHGSALSPRAWLRNGHDPSEVLRRLASHHRR